MLNHDDCAKIGAPPCYCQTPKIGDDIGTIAAATRTRRFMLDALAELTRAADAAEDTRDLLRDFASGDRSVSTFSS